MTESHARVTRAGRIACLALDHPPLHILSTALKRDLLAALAALEADEAVTGIVFTSTGPSFTAGADLKDMERAPEPPYLVDVVEAFVQCRKPSAAALFGDVLGGGLELALACRLRVCAVDARLGFPEIHVGLLPGAQGTCRALRLMAFDKAVQLITGGDRVKADEALALRLVHHVVADKVVDATVALLNEAMAAGTLPASITEERVPLYDEASLPLLRAVVAKKARGRTAPVRVFDFLAESRHWPWAKAVKEERALFLDLRASDEARALRHVFFAEREAVKQARQAAAAARDIKTVAVIGGGLMGAGIAFAALRAGYHTFIVEQPAHLAAAQGRLDKIMTQAQAKHLLAPDDALAMASRLHWTHGLDDIANADLVIEAVVEDMDVKTALFRQMEEAVRPDAILLTNTSYLDLHQLAASLRNPRRFMGLHFFAPAQIMKLVEVVPLPSTQPEVLASVFAFTQALKKIPVMTGPCEGFCANRLLQAYRAAAEAVVEEGASIADVDAAMTAYGFALGPFAAQDKGGLHIAHAYRQRHPALRADGHAVDLLARLVEAGRLGESAGRGWYTYEDGVAYPDPDVDALIEYAARAHHIQRRAFTKAEIQQRLHDAMYACGHELVEGRIAASSSDVDLASIHGLGFPRHKGGVMFLHNHGS